jgi:cell division protein FtsL
MILTNSVTRKVDRKKLLEFICAELFLANKREFTLLTIFTLAALATAVAQCRQLEC